MCRWCCNGRGGEWMMPFRMPYDFSLFVLHCLNLWAIAMVSLPPVSRQRWLWPMRSALLLNPCHSVCTVKRAMCSWSGLWDGGPLTHTMLSHCLSFHMSVILSSFKPTWTRFSKRMQEEKYSLFLCKHQCFPYFKAFPCCPESICSKCYHSRQLVHV